MQSGNTTWHQTNKTPVPNMPFLAPLTQFVVYLINFEIFISTNRIFLKIQYFPSQNLVIKIFWEENFNFPQNISVKVAKAVG
jgi:hypothetical protein